jgi:hypothetical protein
MGEWRHSSTILDLGTDKITVLDILSFIFSDGRQKGKYWNTSAVKLI